MKRVAISLFCLAAIALPSGFVLSQSQASSIFSGKVQRVWEDGFRLNTGDRSITIDAYDLCGDYTAQYIAVGDRVTVTGEFSGREFDAFTIKDVDAASICP
ncbi:MAG: hypothetical protein AAGF24_15530 [Cyanobacteria bacterium P01_H01_bin.121]